MGRFTWLLAVWGVLLLLAGPARGQGPSTATDAQRATPVPVVSPMPGLPPQPPPKSALKPILVPAPKDQVPPSNPLRLPAIDRQALMLKDPDQIHLLNGLQGSDISNWMSLLQLNRRCLNEAFLRVVGLRSMDALQTALRSPNDRRLVQNMVDTSFRYALLGDMMAELIGQPRIYRMKLAHEYERMGLDQMAQALCRDVIVNDRKNGEAYRMAARIEMKAHAFSAALTDLEQLTRLEPKDDWAWTELAELHLLTANYDRARGALHRALAANPNNQQAKELLEGIDHPAQVAPPSDIAREEKAQEKAGMPDAIVQRGQASLKAGRLQEAEACFDQALKVDAKCWSAYMGKGDISFRSSDFFKAVDAYDKAVKLAPSSAEPLYCMALACEAVYQTRHNVPYLDRALQCLHRALELKPDYPAARSAMQRVLEERTNVRAEAP